MRRQVPRPVVAIYALFGVFAVHAVRYAVFPAAGGHAGHHYLEFAPPLLGSLLAVAVVDLALVGAARRRAAEGRRLGWRERWLRGALAFLALYAAQENAEALATAGQLAGPVALLSGGGWLVLPLAVAAGGLLAALLRGTEAVLERLAPPSGARAAAAGTLVTLGAPRAVVIVAAGLARHLAGRAPPAAA